MRSLTEMQPIISKDQYMNWYCGITTCPQLLNPARSVDQLDGWTGLSLLKDRLVQQPDKTQITRRVNT